jgi:hypothetical protein
MAYAPKARTTAAAPAPRYFMSWVLDMAESVARAPGLAVGAA